MLSMRKPVCVILLLAAAASADDAAEISLLKERVTALEAEIAALRALVTPRPAPPVAPAQTPPAFVPSREQGPLAIRIGSTDLKLGGHVDFVGFFRSSNVGSGPGTNFGGIPLENSAAGRLSEMRLTAQGSRLSLRASAQVGKQTLTAYAEADFLGLQPGNVYVTTNANGPRLRHFWVNVARGKWEALGGQAWTLMLPGRNGISANNADVFAGAQVDPNLHVGITWSRVPQFRLVYHATPHWTTALSLENPHQFISPSVTLPAFGTYAPQADAANLHPDMIVKVARDSGRWHAEAAGLLRSFRVVNPETGVISRIPAGAGAFNTSVEVAKGLRVLANTFYGYGGGRYTIGLGPDLIIRGDGTPSGVHSAAAIGGFEYQARPNRMFWAYYGGTYFQRNIAWDPVTRTYVGFGLSASANRSVQQASFGVTETFWRDPRYGALQLLTQYSYLTRSPWSLPAGVSSPHTNMVFVDLRYVLP